MAAYILNMNKPVSVYRDIEQISQNIIGLGRNTSQVEHSWNLMAHGDAR